MRANRIRRLAVLTSLPALLGGAGLASAAVRKELRTIIYHGYSVKVPRSWPVYDLSTAPHTCVRFNRHALYLGIPGTEQRCPAQPAGRTEAILIEPEGADVASAARGAAEPVGGSASAFAVPSAGVVVTATWLHDPHLVARALHRRALPLTRASRLQPRLQPNGSGGGAPTPTPAASIYTGPGFDACDAPSTQQMAAWTSHSAYRAIGIYIGGANAACPPSSDPNLTTAWLSGEVIAGWHFIPTYVGLQAPSNSCGCMPIRPSQAPAEGTAAADDAIAQAQSLGLPSGTPIYDDMEYYARTHTNTSAVLAFLAAWTSELHAKGYVSGVYGNSDSAIADLVTQAGTSYPEPDDVWFASWNGQQTTTDPYIPSADWPNHQRLHQYTGGHSETHGGVTLSIDSNYLDGATAVTVVSLTGPFPPPTLSVFPAASGMTNLIASWDGFGQVGWQVLAGTSPSALTTIGSTPLRGAETKIAVPSAAPYFAVGAIGSSGQVLSESPAVATPGHLGLFGRSSFVGSVSGVGRALVGCYLATACHIVATVSAGRTTVARSAAQSFRSGGSGILYYKLNLAGLRLLARARSARLPVRITLKDTGGTSTSANVSLIPFTTSGRSPVRSLTPGPLVGAAGSTDFVTGGWGGILTRCTTVSACWTTATLSIGRVTIASTGPQLVRGLELGYVFFSLSAKGRQLLKQDHGNQLGTNLLLRCGTSTASARIVLDRYS